MHGLYEKVEAAAAFIRQAWKGTPHAGIILGTGLGSLVKHIREEASLEYGDIPHLPRSTAVSHRGRLVCGQLAGLPVIAMEGRFHMYEGYPLDQITLPVRVMKALGAKLLVVSNACGGMNPYYRSGDIMLIDDHINLMGSNPLVGANDERFGPRFPDMSEVYSTRLRALAADVARAQGLALAHGIYAALHGPSYETPAEIRFLRTIGADAVGMSTAPEAIVARHMGVDVLGISCITNMAAGVLPQPLVHDEVMEVARRVRAEFCRLLEGIVERL
jgi:purine-nucleoside phosphorylase